MLFSLTILQEGGLMSYFTKVFIVIFALVVLLFSSSCDNNVSYTESEVIIEEPSFIEESSEGKSLNSASAKIDKYMLKMTPQWSSSSYAVVGDTSKNVNRDSEGYIEVQPPFNNLGYFSQGLWDFSLRAYAKNSEGNYEIVYSVEKTVEINSESTTINIKSSEILPEDSTSKCTVKLNDFDFLLTGPISEYGNENDLGMKLTYKVTDLSNSSVVVNETDIGSDKIKSDSNGVTGIVESIEIGSGFSSGAYSLSIFLNEYVDGSWIHTGGTSISFVTIPGIEINIAGDVKSIDLYRYDYHNPGAGDSGIIIDSGTDAKVTIETDLTVSSTVTDKTAVTFTGKVDGTVTSGQWFVNGESKNPGSTFRYTPTGMSGKTVTITYMILDSSYNTISANYYLTVSSS